jgi:hypothetical protein
MALVWIEGFEGFGTTDDATPSPTDIVSLKYNEVNEIYMLVKAGRIAGHALSIPNEAYIQTIAGLTTNATIVIGCFFKFNILPDVVRGVIACYSDATVGISVRMNTDGRLAIYFGSTPLSTTVDALLTNTWYDLELKVVVNDSTGSYDLHIDGVSVLSDSNIDTKPGASAYVDTLRVGHIAGGYATQNLIVDDLYVCDGSGAANNDFLGNVCVKQILPTAEGTLSDFTPSGGVDNSLMVDDPIADADSTYVESSTATHTDLYDYSTLSGLSNVKGLQINTLTRVTDAESFDLSMPVLSNVTQDDGSAQTITSTTYVSKMRIVEQDPDTTAAWLVAGINAATFGIKI